MRSSWRLGLFNNAINPVVRRILRSPAHPLLRNLMLVTITGRTSGQEFTIPVGYRREGDRLTVPVGAAPAKRWWRNLRGGAPVKVLLAGRERPAYAEAMCDEATGVTVVIDLSATAPSG
jgi:hypothetical protein